MFTVALFTIAKMTYDFMCVCVHVCMTEYYSAIKKNEIMPFAATWMDPKIIILSKIRTRKTNTV